MANESLLPFDAVVVVVLVRFVFTALVVIAGAIVVGFVILVGSVEFVTVAVGSVTITAATLVFASGTFKSGNSNGGSSFTVPLPAIKYNSFTKVEKVSVYNVMPVHHSNASLNTCC